MKPGQMKNACNTLEISRILQSLIYAMNPEDVRKEILEDSIRRSKHKDNVKFMGTWYLDYNGEPLDHDPVKAQQFKMTGKKPRVQMKDVTVSEPVAQLDDHHPNFIKFVELNKEDLMHKICLFTVCISYNISSVHYVAFIYIPESSLLLSFDPGHQVYVHGQATIVYVVRQSFSKNGLISDARSRPSQDLGKCTDFEFCGIIYGVQFNGDYESGQPMDAMCQTWTVYFLQQAIKHDFKDFSFINDICSITPALREFELLEKTVLPWLKHKRYKKLRETFSEYIHQEVGPDWSLEDAIAFIELFVKQCPQHEEETVSCPRRRRRRQQKQQLLM
jgi:hypothetical protein